MTEKTSAKPRHLGRGLESLLGPIKSPQQTSPTSNAGGQDHMNPTPGEHFEIGRKIPLESISVNPYQARRNWNEEKLAELAKSIEANDMVQPVVVRKTSTGYQLIAGERRFRACQQLGRKTIPAWIRDVSEEQMFELSLVENIHRYDLNPLERAKAYQSYIRQFELTQVEAARRLGEDRSVISNYLRLLDLPVDLQQLLSDGKLSMGHAKAILALPNEALRRKLANRVLAGRLSVRDAEALVKSTQEGQNNQPHVSSTKPPHIEELEQELSSHLGARVSIKARKDGQRGKLVIEFKSLDEFDHLLEIMGMQPAQEL